MIKKPKEVGNICSQLPNIQSAKWQEQIQKKNNPDCTKPLERQWVTI